LFASVIAAFAATSEIYLDSTTVLEDTVREFLCPMVPMDLPCSVDPDTSIAFPATLRIPSKSPLPKFTLVGLGVRKVSFLGIKVYSIGLYADLDNPKLNVCLSH
jgi:hypothetical protein